MLYSQEFSRGWTREFLLVPYEFLPKKNRDALHVSEVFLREIKKINIFQWLAREFFQYLIHETLDR